MAKKATSAPPTPPAEPPPARDRVIDAALSLAASMGWDMVTLSDIASESGLSLAELSALFDDKTDILVGYGRRLDRRMLEAAGTADISTPERERLFDLMMERFDLIGEDRPAVLSILRSFGGDPKQAVISLPHLARSMTWMLEAAGIDTSGIKGALRLAGATGIYLIVLNSWMKDDSPDLSKTMAALDRQLDRAEKVAGTLSL